MAILQMFYSPLTEALSILRSGDSLASKAKLAFYLGLNGAAKAVGRYPPPIGWEMSVSVLKMKVTFRSFSGELGTFLSIFREKCYESEPGFAAQPGDVVFDLGANIGLYAILQGQRITGRGTVYAFEPNPDVYKRLVKNIHDNDLPMVRPVAKAISSTAGRIPFYSLPNSLGSNQYGNGDVHKAQMVEVDSISLDEFVDMEGVARIDIMKLNIEGAEVECLQGGQSKALAITNRVVVQYHSHELRTQAGELLIQQGFKRLSWLETGSGHGIMYFARN